MTFLHRIKQLKLFNRPKPIDSRQLELVIAYLDAQVVYPQIKKILSLNQETLHEFVQQVYHQHPSVYENLKDLFSMHLLLKYYHDFYEFKTKLYRSLWNKLSYPLLLIGCVYGLMGFFLMNVFPMLFGLIQSFDVQMGNLQLIYRVLVFLFVILSILLFDRCHLSTANVEETKSQVICDFDAPDCLVCAYQNDLYANVCLHV